MTVSKNTKLRWRRAGLAFVLTLSTTTLLWTLARQEGRREALRPSPAPTAAPTLFSEPKIAIPEERLKALLSLRAQIATPEKKNSLANELADFARKVHFQSAGRGQLSLSAYNAALSLQREVGNRRAEVGLLQSRAETLALLGKPEQARNDLQQALALSREFPDTAALTLYLLGSSERLAGHYDDARKYLDRSLVIRQKSNERNGEADCLRALGQVSYEEGQLGLSRRSLEEAARIYASLGNAQARAATLGVLGDVALAEGSPAEAETLYAEGLSVWKAVGQDFWSGKFLGKQANLALRKGDEGQAASLAHQSIELLARSNGPIEAAWPRMVLGEIALRQNRAAEGRQLLEQAQREFQQSGSAFALSRVNRLLH